MDLRVIKTKVNIKNTFVQLLLEKDFNEITVQNILDRAMVNRKTFYTHYADKYALTEEIADEFFGEFKELLNLRSSVTHDMKQYLKNAENIYARINENKNTILALWNIRTAHINVYEHMQQLLQQEYMDSIDNIDPDYDIEFQSYLFSTFLLSTLKYMLESDRPFTSEKMMKEFQKFFQVLNTDI